MRKDIKRMSIEAIVQKAMKDIEDNPERGLRNMVDMGATFAKGRFQKPFFRAIQHMLTNEKSAYYVLLKQLIQNTSPNHIIDFGMNVGYNSCTKGASKIRKLEKQYGFNIPWSLSLEIQKERFESDPQSYDSIIEQGRELGIYTYMLYIRNINTDNLFPILNKYNDCAFIIMLRDDSLQDEFFNRMCNMTNSLLVIYDNEETSEICQKLKERHLPYAIYKRYKEEDADAILNGNWITSILHNLPIFFFLIADHSIPMKIQEDVYNYIKTTRYAQVYPTIFADLHHDQLAIDRIISDDECILGFDSNGNAMTHKIKISNNTAFNIWHNDLVHILNHEENQIKS